MNGYKETLTYDYWKSKNLSIEGYKQEQKKLRSAIFVITRADYTGDIAFQNCRMQEAKDMSIEISIIDDIIKELENK